MLMKLLLDSPQDCQFKSLCIGAKSQPAQKLADLFLKTDLAASVTPQENAVDV